ncbi:alpha-glucosidase [Paraliobacillus quinghaiensis]|uniref:Alpha-glucosidase n=1 Tax=Paraliobacillus quinghaiensis TaxID=470815 RepID=A0A917WXJ2_9BACI|nr:glycoside hydrolase family 97 protein [Paraliobacillus quinghaiensis]GGM38670.1 alpha-glucosidase [Paraliobacillus quinghaiensis]
MFSRKRIVLMGALFIGVIVTLSVLGVFENEPKTNGVVESPNGKIGLNFTLTDTGVPNYELSYNDTSIIEPSSLGFEFTSLKPLYNNFQIIKTSTKEFDETWEPVWGEKKVIKNHYNQLTVYLEENESPNRKMNIEFRVYDDGVGFRYVIPKQDNVSKQIEITAENTEFTFAGDYKSWWIPNDWNSYEYKYQETPLSEVKEISTPFTMRTPEGIHLTVHEAALIDYSGMALESVEEKKNTLKSILAPWQLSDVKVKKESLPIQTPWRTIQIGEDAGDLVESDLIVNLNEPSVIEDTSWINPMKYVGIWWGMHVGTSTWGSGPKHGATTANAEEHIDFANEYLDSENQNIGLLVEGWNKGWDGNWMDNGDLFNFTEPYPDYDLEEVVRYAKEKGVAYIAHNETSGDIENYEDQIDAAYDFYQELGIGAIKSGYVADHGIKDPVGHNHHGQYMVNHYLNAVKLAAEHEIMINTHEPIMATGLHRTYPNWMTREGVMGQEYNAWSEGTPPEHLTILPFTRMMAGPIDYTPGIFDIEIANKPNNRVHTTRAQQLALYVTISSGMQMVPDLLDNYKDNKGEILPEFKFIRDVPVTWDDTFVPNAQIGDYITVVRRSGEEWYIGSTTDEHARDLEISLDFLNKEQEYVAEIYSDSPDADLQTNPSAVAVNKVVVDAEDSLVASLVAGGGHAVRIYPVGENK